MNSTEFRPMGKENADALGELGTVFKMNGWSMICRCCGRALPATEDGLLLEHKPACTTAGEQHPWARLRAILNAGVPPVASE